jgi:hypothetical protein
MAALLKDFGDPEILRPYAERLSTAFEGLEKKLTGLPVDTQSSIIVSLADHVLKGVEDAQREAEQELAQSG